MCLFLCQYHSDLITMALSCSLKSGRVSLPALFFFLSVTLVIRDLLWIRTHFRIIFYMSWKNAFGILISVALNL